MQLPIRTVAALCLMSCAATAADSPSRTSAGDVALRVISERSRAYANVCVAKDPSMKSSFDSALSDLRARVETIGRPLLASAQYSSLNEGSAPQELIDAFAAQNTALEKQISGADAARDCPGFLANISRIDDEVLRNGIQQVLAGVQQTLVAMKAADAR